MAKFRAEFLYLHDNEIIELKEEDFIIGSSASDSGPNFYVMVARKIKEENG